MFEIVLGALVVIGIFVFWCDVTDAWNNVFRRNKILENANPRISSAFFKVANYLQGSFDSASGVGWRSTPTLSTLPKRWSRQAIEETEPIEGLAENRPLLMRRFTNSLEG
jgi:hypothetical protein